MHLHVYILNNYVAVSSKNRADLFAEPKKKAIAKDHLFETGHRTQRKSIVKCFFKTIFCFPKLPPITSELCGYVLRHVGTVGYCSEFIVHLATRSFIDES